MTAAQAADAQLALMGLRASLVGLRIAARALVRGGAPGIAAEIEVLLPRVNELVGAVEAWEDHYP